MKKQYKKYSDKLKQEIVNRYLAGESAYQLAKEYNLSVPVLIYQWANKINKIKLENCKLDLNDKLLIENQYLKEQLKLKDKQLSAKEKELQKEQLRGEFLKKHIPSDKKLCQREKEKILNLKYIKIKAFEYIEEYKLIYSVNFMCDFLPVTRQAYYKWIKKNKVRIIRIDYEKDKLIYNKVKKFYNEFNIITGIKNIKIYVEEKLNFQVGIHKLRKINQNIMGLIKWKTNKNIGRDEKTDKHHNLIRPDYIGNDYSTTGKFQKLGMDGTWFNECFVNNTKCKLMFEMVYDLFDGTVITHKPDFTENKYLVGEVLLNVIDKARSSEQIIYIQTDRGRANASKLVKLIENNSSLKLSMSNAGFKHNAPTESLNGWIKEKFYHTYGKKFKNYDELIQKFNEFIKNWNKLKMYLQLNKKSYALKNIGV